MAFDPAQVNWNQIKNALDSGVNLPPDYIKQQMLLQHLSTPGGANAVRLGTTAKIAGDAAGFGLKRVLPAVGGVFDYQEGIEQGEDQARAISSAAASTAGGMAGAGYGASVGAGIGTMILPGPGTAAGAFIGGALGMLGGSKVAGSAVDTAWKLGTDDDGLKPGTDAFKQLKQQELAYAVGRYNNDPTPQNQAEVQKIHTQATGGIAPASSTTSNTPLVAQDSLELLNNYKNIKELNNITLSNPFINQDSDYNKRSRQLADEAKLKEEQLNYRLKTFDNANAMAAKNLDNYWSTRRQNATDIANMANAGTWY